MQQFLFKNIENIAMFHHQNDLNIPLLNIFNNRTNDSPDKSTVLNKGHTISQLTSFTVKFVNPSQILANQIHLCCYGRFCRDLRKVLTCPRGNNNYFAVLYEYAQFNRYRISLSLKIVSIIVFNVCATLKCLKHGEHDKAAIQSNSLSVCKPIQRLSVTMSFINHS